MVGGECESNEGRQQTQVLFTTVRSMTDSFNKKCNLMIVSPIWSDRREGLDFESLYLSCGGKLLVRIVLLKVPSPHGQIVRPEY